MLICLPGMASRVKPRRHLGNAHGAVIDHDELDRDENEKHHDADQVVAAHDELAE